MPELPEVETVARGVRAQALGRRLTEFLLLRPDFYRTPGRAALADPSALLGAVVRRVERAGKYLVLTLENGGRWQLLLHLGMSGRLQWAAPGQAREPHTHAILSFDGHELHFRDPRRFGRIAAAPAPEGGGGFAPALAIAAGWEPLEAGAEEFVALFRGRDAPIKNALLNQKLLRGVGNIYADEALFRAGIHPCARRLSRARLLRLRQAVRAVLREAVRAGGSSISDYRDSDGQPGWFHLRHRVYGRTGEPCLHCGTPIRQRVLGGRSAHFCPRCQKR